MSESKQINFTIVPDEASDATRTYANFCAVNHTPFDFTLTFCEMAPLSEKDTRAAEAEHVVRAPVKTRVVLPVQVVPTLIAALQEQMRIYTESAGNAGRGPVHEEKSHGAPRHPRVGRHQETVPPAPWRGPGARRATRALPVIRQLYRQHPDADTELDYKNPYELLVATILSAQSTDAGVNRVTPSLFARYPEAAALANATASELEPLIHSTGFYRAKAKSLMGMARALVERHGGKVPAAMDALVELPGVGRKTANVVLGHALGVPGLPVDRHVLRVSNRIGIAASDDPVEVEQQLCKALPPAEWTKASDTLILHGRRICKPKPLCDQCVVRDDCNFYRANA